MKASCFFAGREPALSAFWAPPTPLFWKLTLKSATWHPFTATYHDVYFKKNWFHYFVAIETHKEPLYSEEFFFTPSQQWFLFHWNLHFPVLSLWQGNLRFLFQWRQGWRAQDYRSYWNWINHYGIQICKLASECIESNYILQFPSIRGVHFRESSQAPASLKLLCPILAFLSLIAHKTFLLSQFI